MRKIRKLPHLDGELGWFETSVGSTQRLGPRLKGTHEFDIVVVGAGFTGISAALRLAEINPSARIALVDALRVGQGTSGRNAGFLIDLPHNVKFDKAGPEYARSLYRLNMFAIDRLREIKDRFSIPTWHDAGKYMAAHEPCNQVGLDHFEKLLKHAGFEYEKVAGKDLSCRLGTDFYTTAIYTPGNILVNPATLVRSLVKALPKNVSLFEDSPVRGIEYGPPHRLGFLGGSITAPIVVQATNSFAEEFGKLPNRTVPVFTYASLTSPVPQSLLDQHFRGVNPWGVTSAHQAGSTVRFTHDKRIFVRNVYDYHGNLKTSDKSLEKAWQQHRASFEARFPFLKELNFEFTWGGMICMTANYKPVFKSAGDGIHILSGCNGVGVVRGTYLGYYMADYICGIESSNLDLVQSLSKPLWIPPDPLRSIGATARIAWESSGAKGDV